ncbi:MAG TPA: ATP-dependent helicase [Anaerolineales bacterium]
MEFIPRPKQQEVLDYTGGYMGVSAVPGSGKTWTLSLLAAQIVASGELDSDQEVLVVTLVNSAVDNFYKRVSDFIQAAGLLPHLGYRVRTLHGLAHDIVRERPELVGLADNFQIIDERQVDSIRSEVAEAWLRANPNALDGYLNPELDDERLAWVRREPLPNLVSEIALSFIRYAKDLQLTPERLRLQLESLPVPLSLAEMGHAIYADYQRALSYRGAVDFDDLIRLALEALRLDDKLLERMRYRWPYILEDEAQDSSRLQEEILKTLAGPGGNWVRVGDPNQAIYETFTTANPKYLRAFIKSRGVLGRELPNSGRSTQTIINLANHLVKWTQRQHPVRQAREALGGPPFIEPVPEGDEGANPPDDLSKLHLVARKYSPVDEISAVVDSLQRWLPDHPDDTVAVLVPRNQRGFELVDVLRRRGIEVVDSLLRSTASTRFSARVLTQLLSYLSDPGSPSRLALLYKAWQRGEQAGARRERVSELLRKCGQVEDFIWPNPGQDWLEELDLEDTEPQVYTQLLEFRQLVRRWQEAILLPVDQMILTASQDLFTEPSQLALAHKLAALLRQAGQSHPSWRLPELTEELAVIARNERRFLGFSDDDTGFDPGQYRGKVVVATMHKAKGLEWDRVYLMSVNTYDFPSGLQGDRYISEKWFLRDSLNLEAETLAQLDALLSIDEYTWYQESEATHRARLDYVRERLRLFYVGITRAKKELVVTWNTGRRGELQPSTPLLALMDYVSSQETSNDL